jgi:3-dehydroquinate synthase
MQTVTIPVNLPQQPYNVVIAAGGLDRIGPWLRDATLQATQLGHKILIVSNVEIFRHYGERVVASLEGGGFEVGSCILPAGERYKTLESVQKIYDSALEQRIERSSTLLALGGGVIGDMAGFAAATWLRGIPVVQVPTSLLAMVDASIGGKTGVNHPQGKNLIGAFHQPRLVLIDPEVLQTLPPREFRAAIAEVIKYGVIWDAELFEQMEACDRLDQLRSLPPELLQTILTRSCQAKVDVVTQDEKEAGLRAILNYGHTIGHAIESLTGYRQFNHGEAVGLGMLAAGAIGVDLGLWDQNSCDRQRALVEKAGLPTQVTTALDPAAVLNALQADKKVKAGRVRFILPTQIGAATITDQVPPEAVMGSLQQL